MVGVVLAVVGGVVTAKWIARAIWWRRMRRLAWMAHAGGFGGHGYGHGRHGGGWRRHPHGHGGDGHDAGRAEGGSGGGFRGSALYRVFERLDATPAQERVIRAAIEKLEAQAAEGRKAHEEARKAIAAALRHEVLTPESLQDLYVAHAKRLDGVRDAVAATIGEVHAALDAKQREALAAAIEAGELDLGLGALFGAPPPRGDDPFQEFAPFVRGWPHHVRFAGACGPC